MTYCIKIVEPFVDLEQEWHRKGIRDICPQASSRERSKENKEVYAGILDLEKLYRYNKINKEGHCEVLSL